MRDASSVNPGLDWCESEGCEKDQEKTLKKIEDDVRSCDPARKPTLDSVIPTQARDPLTAPRDAFLC